MTETDLYNTLSEDRQDAEKPRCNGFRYYRPMRSSGSTTKLLFMFDGLHWKADTASMQPCRAFGCQALSYHWFHLAVADSLVSTLRFSITALAVFPWSMGLLPACLHPASLKCGLGSSVSRICLHVCFVFVQLYVARSRTSIRVKMNEWLHRGVSPVQAHRASR